MKKLNKCKSEVKKIFKKYGYRPKEINGTNFPKKFMMFRNWMRLAGRDIYFFAQDICQGNQKVDEREESLYNEFKLLRYRYEDELESIRNEINEKDLSDEEKKVERDKKRKELADVYEEKFTAAYKAILEVELRHGLVRVVQVTECHDKNATVKSKYTDRELNYSPVLISIPKFEEKDSISKHASLFANALIRPYPCSLIKIYLGKEIKKEEVSQIYKMMSEVVCIFNTYHIAEYEKKKDSPEYQHRDDWDPANF